METEGSSKQYSVTDRQTDRRTGFLVMVGLDTAHIGRLFTHQNVHQLSQ